MRRSIRLLRPSIHANRTSENAQYMESDRSNHSGRHVGRVANERVVGWCRCFHVNNRINIILGLKVVQPLYEPNRLQSVNVQKEQVTPQTEDGNEEVCDIAR